MDVNVVYQGITAEFTYVGDRELRRQQLLQTKRKLIVRGFIQKCANTVESFKS